MRRVLSSAWRGLGPTLGPLIGLHPWHWGPVLSCRVTVTEPPPALLGHWTHGATTTEQTKHTTFKVFKCSCSKCRQQHCLLRRFASWPQLLREADSQVRVLLRK